MKRTLAPLFLLLFLGVAFAVAPPEPGMQLYGHVTGALDGTKITAVIGDSTETTVIDGKYGYSPNTFIVTRPTTEYNEIRIYIGGTLYTAIPFQSGGLKELNIIATSMTFCGNGVCDGAETHSTCPIDCEAPTPTSPPTNPQPSVIPPPPEVPGPTELNEPLSWSGGGRTVRLYGAFSNTSISVNTSGPGECEAMENVYEYINVSIEGNYSDGEVSVTVRKAWYGENDLNVETTTILHCKNGEWEDIGASVVEENAESITFLSGRTRFSVIAVTAEPNVHEVVEEQPTSAEETPTQEPTPQETGPTGLAILADNAWAVILGALIVLGLSWFVLGRR